MARKALRFAVFSLICLAFGSTGFCATDPCDAIMSANKTTVQGHASYSTTGKSTGVKIAPFMAKIHMHAQGKTCKFVREDSVDGEAVSVYSQHLAAPEGSTDEEIWVSKKSNRILREEIEGDITGSGRGHLSMLFHYK